MEMYIVSIEEVTEVEVIGVFDDIDKATYFYHDGYQGRVCFMYAIELNTGIVRFRHLMHT